MILRGEKPTYPNKKLSQYQFIHHKFYWTALESNRCLQGERPTTKRRKLEVIFYQRSLISKEHCVLEGPQASTVCPYVQSKMWMKMSIEQWSGANLGLGRLGSCLGRQI